GPATSPREPGSVSGVPGLWGVTSILVPGHDTACEFGAMHAEADGSDPYLRSGTWSLVNLGDSSLFNPASMRDAFDAQLGRRSARASRDLEGYVNFVCRSIGRRITE